jgi:hypothetical protein
MKACKYISHCKILKKFTSSWSLKAIVTEQSTFRTLSKFDLALSILLAGYSFETYNEPVSSFSI